jgi:prepilin signal peptidase PulO-like enzyme (type II secretory pathway)
MRMILIVAALGLTIAVFLNGLADNLLREDVLPPGEYLIPRCAYCDSPRKTSDLSAMFSTLFLSGACRRCGAPRPFRDLLVEALLLAGLPAAWILNGMDLNALLSGALILSACILFSIIDLEHRIVAVEAVALVCLALLLIRWLSGGDVLIRTLIGGIAGLAIFLILFLLGEALSILFKLGQGAEPLGFGDVILAALVGCITGWPSILLAVFLSIFLGGIFGLGFAVFALVRRSPLRTATMAYGPYLLLSALIVFYFGTPFLGAFLNLLGVLR